MSQEEHGSSKCQSLINSQCLMSIRSAPYRQGFRPLGGRKAEKDPGTVLLKYVHTVLIRFVVFVLRRPLDGKPN